MRNSQALLPGAAFEPERLLAPTQAVHVFRAAVAIALPSIETVSLNDSAGRILARDIVADAAYPTHARSTMDGFALASSDGATARRVAGEIRMGARPPHALGAGEAMRIPTGGALPEGADAVVPFEDADVIVAPGDPAETLVLREALAAGENVTQAGSDMARGACVLALGRRIGGPELGVLATLGVTAIPVYRRPRIAIVSTGDELIEPSGSLEIGQVRDSNRYAIAGSLIALGAIPVHVPRAPDTLDGLLDVLRAALADADAVLLTGGSSVGARDLTPDAIEALRGTVHVHGIRVKPGKPTVFASIDGKPVIGLPGNPTSALMILEAVIAPIVSALVGEVAPRTDGVRAIAAEEFQGRVGWTWYVPAELRAGRAFPLPLRSAHTSLLARASGYVILGEDTARIAAGTALEVVRFSSGGRT